MAHALLSASGSERWLNCPPSARLEENLPGRYSNAAEEGTLAHAVAELMNMYNFSKVMENGFTKKKFNAELANLEKNQLYSAEMLEHASTFSSYVSELYQEKKKKKKSPLIYFEHPIDFRGYVPEGFGRGDVLLVSDDEIHIIDYKYGTGVPVSAENNSQMQLYALGAYDEFSFAGDYENAKLSIYQPRIDNFSDWDISFKELLGWAGTEVKTKAELAFDGAGDFNPSPKGHCKFCKAKPICKALAEHNLKLMERKGTDPRVLNNSEIADILKTGEGLSDWLNAIEDYTVEKLLEGETFEGFKVVEGRSIRKYTDITAIADILQQEKYSEDEIFKKDLIGIGAMEKLLGKTAFVELLHQYVDKPQGKPTLAPETDKRPVFSTAAKDFAEIANQNL